MTYYNANVGPGGANQPLNYSPAVTTDKNGNATFNFPAVPTGQIWTGTVTVINAPDSANMTISSVGVQNTIGQFIGGNNWGPVQLGTGDQLIITATGLLPNTVYTCNFQGTAITGGDPGITYPEAYAHTVTIRAETTQLATGTKAMPTNYQSFNVTVPVNPNFRSLYVIVLTVGNNLSIQPTSLQWGVTATTDSAQGIYGYPVPYDGSSSVTGPPRVITSNVSMFRFPLVAGMANNLVTFTISASYLGTPTTSIEYIIGADVENTDVAVFPTSQIINSPLYTPGASNPLIGTNYGGFPIENTYYYNSSFQWVVEPLQVALTNTVGTPFFVETVSGSTTAVTNTSAAPLYVENTTGTPIFIEGIAGGTAVPISGSVTTSGTVTNTPATVTPATSSSSGTTASSLIAIKASAGTVYGIYLFNNSTTVNTYLQVWNLGTGSITIGTTAPLYSFGVPYGGGAFIPFPEPLAFSTAITIAATTTRAGSTYATTGLDYDIIYV